jgi:hypothetical protein
MKGISSKCKISKHLTKEATAHLDIDNKSCNYSTVKRIVAATYQELEAYNTSENLLIFKIKYEKMKDEELEVAIWRIATLGVRHENDEITGVELEEEALEEIRLVKGLYIPISINQRELLIAFAKSNCTEEYWNDNIREEIGAIDNFLESN